MFDWLVGKPAKSKLKEWEPKFNVGDTVMIVRKGPTFAKIGTVIHYTGHLYFVKFDDYPAGYFDSNEIKRPERIEELLYAKTL